MKKIFYIYIIICYITLIGCKNDNQTKIINKADVILLQKTKAYISPLPVFDIKDRSSAEKLRIDLGEKLFFDSLLSFNNTQSCNTCHPLNSFGMDNKRVSEGANGRTGTRNTPTVFNATLQFAQFWDAHVKTIEEQASGPIFGTDEMGMKDTLTLIHKLKNAANYQELFDHAYPHLDTSISIQTISNSLGAFQKTLITHSNRFDQYLNGNLNKLTTIEKKGLNNFIDKGCIPCHSGSLLGGNMKQKFAVYGYYWDYTGSTFFDKGLYKHTKNTEDKFVFKVPGLRNVAQTAPYFHDGSVKTLYETIKIMAQTELNTNLTDQETKEIEAFLRSLNGELINY